MTHEKIVLLIENLKKFYLSKDFTQLFLKANVNLLDTHINFMFKAIVMRICKIDFIYK